MSVLKSGFTLDLILGVNILSTVGNTEGTYFDYPNTISAVFGIKPGTKIYFNQSPKLRLGIDANLLLLTSIPGTSSSNLDFDFETNFEVSPMVGPTVIFSPNGTVAIAGSFLVGASLLNEVDPVDLDIQTGVAFGPTLRFGIKKFFVGFDLIYADYFEVEDYATIAKSQNYRFNLAVGLKF